MRADLHNASALKGSTVITYFYFLCASYHFALLARQCSAQRQLLPVTEASTELSYDDVANLGMASPSPNVSRAKKSKVPKKDFLAAEAVVGRTPPKRQRPEDEEEATDAVAVNPTPPHVGRGVVVSGAKKLKTGDESMPSIPKGARVYVREDTQSHVQCAGKVRLLFLQTALSDIVQTII